MITKDKKKAGPTPRGLTIRKVVLLDQALHDALVAAGKQTGNQGEIVRKALRKYLGLETKQ